MSCFVSSGYTEFGPEPCPGTRKYLEVHYYCHNGTEKGIIVPQTKILALGSNMPPSVFQFNVEFNMSVCSQKYFVAFTVINIF